MRGLFSFLNLCMHYQRSQRHICFSMGKRMSSLLLTLGRLLPLTEISDISEVQQFISVSHEFAQQVVLITQELILAEVINAEIIDSDIIHAIELIVSQASSVDSTFSSHGVSSFDSSHQLLDSLKAYHTQAYEHEDIAAPSSICFSAIPPPMATAPLPITSPQPWAAWPWGLLWLQLPLSGNQQRVFL